MTTIRAAPALTVLVFLLALTRWSCTVAGWAALSGFLLISVLLILVPISVLLLADREGVPCGEMLRRALAALPLLILWLAVPHVPRAIGPVCFTGILTAYVLAVAKGPRGALVHAPTAAILLALAVVPLREGFHKLALDAGPDNYCNVYAPLVYLSSGLAQGELPLWNNACFFGMPMGADPMWGSWYPLNFLAASFVAACKHAFPYLAERDIWNEVFNHYYALNSLITAGGIYVMLRGLGMSRAASLIGSAAFPVASLEIQIQFTWLWSLLPWIVYTFVRACRTQRRSMGYLCGLLTGAAALSGQPQGVLYTAIALAPLMALEFCTEVYRAPQRREMLRGLLRVMLVMGLAAGTTGALLWLPARDYQRETYRWIARGMLVPGEKLTYADTLVQATASFRDLAFTHYQYLGVSAVLFVVLAVFRPRPMILIATAMAALFALASVGDGSPVHPWLFHHFPGWALFRCLCRTNFLVYLYLAILVAWGVDVWRDRRSRKVFWPAVLITVALLVAFGRWTGSFDRPNRPPLVIRADMVILAVLIAVGAMRRHLSDCRWIGGLVSGRLGNATAALALAASFSVNFVDKAYASKNFYATLWPNDPVLMETAEDIERFLAPYRVEGRPFRVLNRFASPLHLFTGFCFGWETLEGYGGLAYVGAYDAIYSRIPEELNVRFVVLNQQDGPNPLPKDWKQVHKNSRFTVFETQTWRPRYATGLRGKGPLPPGTDNAIHIHRSGRNQVLLTVNTVSHDGLWVNMPWHRNWRATIDGRRVPVQEQNKLQYLDLPPHSTVRVHLYYRDRYIRFLLPVILVHYLGFVAIVWLSLRHKAPDVEPPRV